jgi:HK97 family phage major capsid protein
VVRMPSGVEKVPVVSAAPTSGFVNPAYGGLKPYSAVDWQSEVLTAGEIATVLAIPNAFLDDTTFAVWESVRDEIAKSFTKTFEAAALYGTSAPADWPAGGLTAAANADSATGADPLDALDQAMSHLETHGIEPTGILGGAKLRAALRSQMVSTLQPFSEAPAQIYGVPVMFSTNWNDATGMALVPFSLQ